MQTSPVIVYLHGLNSSPLSFKAQQLRQAWLALGLPETQLYSPALHHNPRVALQEVEAYLEQQPEAILVGSSLGGYYATYLAEKYQRRALLINPAVQPHVRFEVYLGPQENFYTGERWTLTREHIAALASLSVAPPQDAQRYWVWLQTGDETLDYRDALSFYQGCTLDVQEGGDHGYAGFEQRIPELLAFAGLRHRA